MNVYKGGVLLKRRLGLLMILSIILILTGCGQKKNQQPVSGEKIEKVSGPILNAEGNKIGEVGFVETADGVTIDILAEGLTPGKKGIHIHETGECMAPDFKSAGNHLNPHSKEHGFENPKGYHLGDLPNIEVDPDGTVNVSLTLNEITLQPGAENTILDKDGSSIVIHENEDDYKTDPAGDSGARIACAVIQKK